MTAAEMHHYLFSGFSAQPARNAKRPGTRRGLIWADHLSGPVTGKSSGITAITGSLRHARSSRRLTVPRWAATSKFFLRFTCNAADQSVAQDFVFA